MKKVRYFHSFDMDFVETPNQEFSLPEDYQWISQGRGHRFLSGLVYGCALVFGTVYCRLFLHMRVTGREKLKKVRGGFFLYGNHTQPLGDVFTPALCLFPRRIYTVVSTANYALPVIGKLLPYLGALPIEKSLHGIRSLNVAISERIQQGHPVVIYPEAHVWEYYTEIRPFRDTAMKYPVRNQVPAFSMTVTYQKRKFFRKPAMRVYLDGPFYPEGDSIAEKTCDLYEKVRDAMLLRSKSSNCSYIEYCPAPNPPI